MMKKEITSQIFKNVNQQEKTFFTGKEYFQKDSNGSAEIDFNDNEDMVIILEKNLRLILEEKIDELVNEITADGIYDRQKVIDELMKILEDQK